MPCIQKLLSFCLITAVDDFVQIFHYQEDCKHVDKQDEEDMCYIDGDIRNNEQAWQHFVSEFLGFKQMSLKCEISRIHSHYINRQNLNLLSFYL